MMDPKEWKVLYTEHKLISILWNKERLPQLYGLTAMERAADFQAYAKEWRELDKYLKKVRVRE
jgi:hypothetical protein